MTSAGRTQESHMQSPNHASSIVCCYILGDVQLLDGEKEGGEGGMERGAGVVSQRLRA